MNDAIQTAGRQALPIVAERHAECGISVRELNYLLASFSPPSHGTGVARKP
jgi:hypothetical protein